MTLLSDIDIALIAIGLKEEDDSPKYTGKSTTLCKIYSYESRFVKLKVTVQATPKATLLELAEAEKTGGIEIVQ